MILIFDFSHNPAKLSNANWSIKNYYMKYLNSCKNDIVCSHVWHSSLGICQIVVDAAQEYVPRKSGNVPNSQSHEKLTLQWYCLQRNAYKLSSNPERHVLMSYYIFSHCSSVSSYLPYLLWHGRLKWFGRRHQILHFSLFRIPIPINIPYTLCPRSLYAPISSHPRFGNNEA